jgi:hypothetical protein
MLCRIHDDDDDDDDDDDPRNVASMQTPDAADIPRTLHRIYTALEYILNVLKETTEI